MMELQRDIEIRYILVWFTNSCLQNQFNLKTNAIFSFCINKIRSNLAYGHPKRFNQIRFHFSPLANDDSFAELFDILSQIKYTIVSYNITSEADVPKYSISTRGISFEKTNPSRS